MRLLLAMAAFAALTVCAFAQPPLEIKPDERIDLRIGQARTFQFDKPYSGFSLASEGIVKLNVQTDRTFTILGTGPGETLITVTFNDQDIHRMSVTVGGRTVRMYGTGKDEKDYIGYFCTSTECGRGDSDAPQPNGLTIEKRSMNRKGEMTTTTKSY